MIELHSRDRRILVNVECILAVEEYVSGQVVIWLTDGRSLNPTESYDEVFDLISGVFEWES